MHWLEVAPPGLGHYVRRHKTANFLWSCTDKMRLCNSFQPEGLQVVMLYMCLPDCYAYDNVHCYSVVSKKWLPNQVIVRHEKLKQQVEYVHNQKHVLANTLSLDSLGLLIQR